MTFCLLTPTGDRPEAFALCERWMARQTLPPVQWIVLDDGRVPTRCTLGQRYIRCPELRGRASLTRKIRLVLDASMIAADALAIVEDDDWYAPDYLAVQAERLGDYLMAGEGCAVYYNVAWRWWVDNDNRDHASLCQTVVAREAFSALRRACVEGHPSLDEVLWEDAELCRKRVFLPQDRRTTIGIKAMPGRLGYGNGHRPPDGSVTLDPDLAKLHALIGDDAERYRGFASWRSRVVLRLSRRAEWPPWRSMASTWIRASLMSRRSV